MLYLKAFAQLFHHLINEIRSIISNDILGNPIMTNYILLDEAINNFLGDVGIRCIFDPFGEVINGNQNKVMPLEAIGSICSIISMSYIVKGQVEVQTFSILGGTCILFA